MCCVHLFLLLRKRQRRRRRVTDINNRRMGRMKKEGETERISLNKK